MPKATGPGKKAQVSRSKPPAADPKLTRGKDWDRTLPPFEAAHSAFEATVVAQRQLVSAIMEKLGIDVDEMARVQLQGFDAAVKAVNSLPTDIPGNGEAQP